MKTKSIRQALRRCACMALLMPAVLMASPAHADDWERAQAAFSELKDLEALGHLQRAAVAGDARAHLALSLVVKHGHQLFPGVLKIACKTPSPQCFRKFFPGVLKTDPVAAQRWRLAVDASLGLPASSVPTHKRTRSGLYLSATQALMMKEAAHDEVVMLDIRSRAEVTYVGMPTLADALVPFREHREFTAEWNADRHTLQPPLNPGFAEEVARVLQSRGLGKDTRLILLCRSGDRSAAAADLLHAQGYSAVHTVVDGFEGDLGDQGRRDVNGWKHAGLPWTYKLQKEKLWVGL